MKIIGKILLLSCYLAMPTIYAKNNTLQIAVAAPFSGKYQAYGQVIWQGASIAIDNLNKSGGILGLPLTLVKIDYSCDPHVTLDLPKQLYNQHSVVAVLGHACSENSLININKYASLGKLIISPSSPHMALSQAGNFTFFRLILRNDQQANIISNLIYTKYKNKKIAIIHSKSIYSRELSNLVSQQLRLKGKAINLETEITQIKLIENLIAKKITVIFLPGHIPEISSLRMELTKRMPNLKIIHTDVIDSSRSLPSQAATEAIIQALLHSKDYSGKSLASWLHYNQVPTILGKITWDTNGDLYQDQV